MTHNCSFTLTTVPLLSQSKQSMLQHTVAVLIVIISPIPVTILTMVTEKTVLEPMNKQRVWC